MQYTSYLDLWIDGTICRPTSSDDDVDKIPSTSTTSSTVCPSNYQPLLQAKGISKYITLPSSTTTGSSDDTVQATTTGTGIRAPATLQFQ
jgi:hypothetical protein